MLRTRFRKLAHVFPSREALPDFQGESARTPFTGHIGRYQLQVNQVNGDKGVASMRVCEWTHYRP